MNSLFRILISIGLAMLPAVVHAAPPQTINYQGYLTSPAGAPINAAVSMTFRIYNAASGGGALWSETQPGVNVTNGSFNVTLGSVSSIPLPFDVPYWFTVAVNADAEMSPRQPLASSAYAFRAATADAVSPSASVAGGQLTGSITTATIPAANVIGGSSGTVTSISTGQGLLGGPITSSGTLNLASTQLLPTSTCIPNQIAKWNGAAWQCAPDDNVPPGGSPGQILVFAFGAPQWTSTPTLSGTLTLQGNLEFSGGGFITKSGSRYLHSNGSGNIFLGLNAGNLGGGAGNNTAVGEQALPNVNGSANTAIGRGAGSATNSGNNNTFIGTSAGSGLGGASSNNIMIGNGAGSVVNTGSDSSIYIGNTGNATDFRAIRIGTVGTQLSTVIAGISGFVSGGGSAVFINASGQLGTSTSSRRYKDTIADMDEASSALMKLRPVTFYYKADKNPAGRELQYGLIAEEVNEIYPGLVAHGLDGQIETVMYQFLPPMLLNEFQKQQRTLQSQAARLETLERELQEIKSLLGRK